MPGDEMKRVALARALINSPELITADKPTSDLDMESAREMADLLSLLSGKSCAFLVATHGLELSRQE